MTTSEQVRALWEKHGKSQALAVVCRVRSPLGSVYEIQTGESSTHDLWCYRLVHGSDYASRDTKRGPANWKGAQNE